MVRIDCLIYCQVTVNS